MYSSSQASHNMLFVSYSWHDRSAVELYISALRTSGQKYWIDSENLDLNQPIESQLRMAVLSARAILHFDTESSRRSNWVQFEMRTAQAEGRFVITVCDFTHRISIA